MPEGKKLRTLAKDVAVVATFGYGWWTAYIGAALERNHEDAIDRIASDGDKLPYEVAKILFPCIDERFTWRP